MPPSKLIVKNNFPPKVFFIRVGLLLRGGDFIYIYIYIYIGAGVTGRGAA